MSRGPVKRELVEDKVVWITGASRGIGEVLAKQFAALGAKLILSARNVAELGRVRSELVGVEILPLDLVSGERYLKAAVDKAEAFFSDAGVDYMIHNAAYEHPKSSSLVATEAELQATLNTDVLGTTILTKLLVPHMLRRGKGHFVVSHVSAERCAELTIVAATHGLKEAWISHQPVLLMMYAARYMPAFTYWFMDKIGERRMEAISNKGKVFSWSLLFGEKKKAS